jgi:hypothetical protein
MRTHEGELTKERTISAAALKTYHLDKLETSHRLSNVLGSVRAVGFDQHGESIVLLETEDGNKQRMSCR